MASEAVTLYERSIETPSRGPLTTQLVEVLSQDNHTSVQVCVGLDSMSNDTYVSKKLVKLLKLETWSLPGRHTSVGMNNQTMTVHKYTHLTLRKGQFRLQLSAYVIPEIVESVQVVNAQSAYAVIKGKSSTLVLEDRPLAVLIASSYVWALQPAVINVKLGNQPHRFVTNKLGVALVDEETIATDRNMVSLVSVKDLDRSIKKFFSLEHLGISKHDDDENIREEMEAIERLNDTTELNGTVFTMPLLFKANARPLYNNRQLALHRLRRLERQLERRPDLRKDYAAEIQDLFDREVARPLLPQESPEEAQCFYLPHRAVERPDKETTKIRPVFDASAKTTEGYSLNSEILKTPVQLPKLPGILVRFRFHRIAMISDISKMFHRIHLRQDHVKYQRFLWRDDPREPPKDYVITKVAFGVKDSPYKCIRAVEMLLDKYGRDYPLADKVLRRNLYVDDIITGAANEEEAVQLYKQCDEILKKGSFPLRKWCSNSTKVMEAIPDADRGQTGKLLLSANMMSDDDSIDEMIEAAQTKTLGVQWNAEEDTVLFAGYADMKLPMEQHELTKRNMLSAMAKFYDPIGLAAPHIIMVKILFQGLWQVEGLDWDDPVPEDVRQAWIEWAKEIDGFGAIRYPRCIKRATEPLSMQLVLFTDASEKALAAVVYVRLKYGDDDFDCHLVLAKAKVAPSKQMMTLPRKELAAAAIGAELLKTAAEETDLKLDEAICFTDSITALQWINKPPGDLKQWVARRVISITEVAGPARWRHVPGTDNVADLPSRGRYARELFENDFWACGPPWLRRAESEWPPEPEAAPSPEAEAEQRSTSAVTLVQTRNSVETKFRQEAKAVWATSDFNKFKVRLAYLLRWRKLKNLQIKGEITAEELDEAQQKHIWLEQRFAYGPQIRALERSKPASFQRSEAELLPFLDQEGLLRVGGRLGDGDFPREERFPIILPAVKAKKLIEFNDTFTGRLMWHLHVTNCHAGANWLYTHMRERYFPIAGRQALRRMIKLCGPCQLANKKTSRPIMAPLPRARLKLNTCWTYVGVDFTGEIRLLSKHEATRVPRAYVIIFTDLTSRGVHFEVVRKMETHDFFVALRRMMAVRGKVSHLFSDEARNFLRGRNELYYLFKFMDHRKFKDKLTSMGIEWKTNAPLSPFRGGVWERLLRTMKNALRAAFCGRATAGHYLKFEQLVTAVAEISSMMNDRPLVAPTEGPDDDAPITPSMIMYGRRLGQLPDVMPPSLEGPPKAQHMLALWRERMIFANAAWKAFYRSYVQNVLVKTPEKWRRNEEAPIALGEIVLLSTEKPARGEWPRARVVAVEDPNPRDQFLRTFRVRLPDGRELVRSAPTLVRLELDYGDDPEPIHFPDDEEEVPEPAELSRHGDVRGPDEEVQETSASDQAADEAMETEAGMEGHEGQAHQGHEQHDQRGQAERSPQRNGQGALCGGPHRRKRGRPTKAEAAARAAARRAEALSASSAAANDAAAAASAASAATAEEAAGPAQKTGSQASGSGWSRGKRLRSSGGRQRPKRYEDGGN